MIKNVTIDRDTVIRGITEPNLVDLSFYARDNIPNYQAIAEIPKENMDYINSVKYAVNCMDMFFDCRSLELLNLSNFDTSKVTNMSYMFSGCRALLRLELSSFNTSNVTSMNNMFIICGHLHYLDISNWDTSNVTNMSRMFGFCNSLTTIKGTLDLSSCEKVDSMFKATSGIKGVHLKNVPRSLLDIDGSLKKADGTLNETYIIDNILEDK